MVAGLPAECAGAISDQTLGSLLAAHGYRTHHVGKWHNGQAAFERSFQTGRCVFMGGMADPFDTPLESWDGHRFGNDVKRGAHATDVFAEAARHFLSSVAGAEPFFLSVAFTAPHDPRRTHPEFHLHYPPDSVEMPPNFREHPPLRRDRLPVRDELCLPLPRDAAAVRRELGNYFAMVEHLDHAVGRVLDAVPDNTLVAYTSDHGLSIGQHGLLGKQNVFDASIRVPLLMRGPGIDAGVANRTLVYQHDLFPTLLGAAGVQVGPDVVPTEFRSLKTGLPRTSIETFYGDEWHATTDGRQKVTRHLPQGTTWTFDLDADPWEQCPSE